MEGLSKGDMMLFDCSETRFRQLLLGATAIAAMMVATNARAQERTQLFDIPAQAAADALNEWARQADRQIVFPFDAVQGRRTDAVQGEMTLEQALARLTGPLGLSVSSTKDGTVTLAKGPLAGEHEAGQVPAASVNVEGDDREIVVTGSIIRGAAPSGANLIVLGREDLDKTGRGTLAEAIQTLPQVHGGGMNDATTRTPVGAAPNNYGSFGAYGSTSLNLRGLGVEETLTLVNGRRLAPSGNFGAIADISALPMAAVERVEILADGASATYGADAMAGVVNIIMNRRFEGAETRLRAGLETRSGQPEFQASQTFGWAFDRGNFLLSADFTRRDSVTGKGRPFAASDDLRPFGGGDWRGTYCSPGNILDSERNLIGAIPAGQNGRALTPDQIRRGERNRCNRTSGNSNLIPQTVKGSIYLSGSYDLTDKLRVNLDAIAMRNRAEHVGNYRAADLRVPISNAFRQLNGFSGDSVPYNEQITIQYQFTEVDPRRTDDDVWSVLATLGADYSLGVDWELALQGSYGRYDHKRKSLELDTRSADHGGRLNQALASNDLATAFNPFGDERANRRSLVESFLYQSRDLQGSDFYSANITLNGALFNLPGGAMKLAVGGDYRQERFFTRGKEFFANIIPLFEESSSFNASREAMATYAELFIPLFSERNSVNGIRRLNISLSGRYDHYSDFGDTFNPKAGVTWAPIEGVTIKGSYGTSFKAPLLPILYSGTELRFTQYAGNDLAPDLNRDGQVSALIFSGGNPDLEPEKGKSWTAGIEIKPALLPGLQVRASYFKLTFTGRFAAISNPPMAFMEPAAYQEIAYFPQPSQSQVDKLIARADRVVGSVPPSSSIEAILDLRTMNFASQVMDGVDAGASYTWQALGGTFSLSGDLSYLSRYKSRLARSVSVVSYIGNVGLPSRLKASGGLGWTGSGVSLNGRINHTDSYANKMVTPHESVSSYTTVDLSAQIRLGGWARRLIGDDASLTFYATNLFDQDPPFVNNFLGVGYDGANADPIGRRIAVQLTKRW